MFDYYDTEAAHLGDMYIDFEARDSYRTFAEEVAEAEYQRANTITTLAGLDEDYYTRQRERRKRRNKEIEKKDRLNREKQKKGNKDLFIVIQDSRKDNTTLMLVDRRKSKEYWWTHDFSLAYKGGKEEMEKVASKLRKNNVRVVSCNKYDVEVELKENVGEV